LGLVASVLVFGVWLRDLRGQVQPLRASVEGNIREPVFAGQWYPAKAEELRRMVNGFITAAKHLPKVKGRLLGLVSPHAGFVYSGPVAGYGYRLLKELHPKLKTVILIGPAHRYPLEGISLNNVLDYKTPLGVVPNDRALGNKIIQASKGAIKYLPQAHRYEHSLEAQLPFLQCVLGEGFMIVPILVNREALSKKLAEVLTEVLSKRADILIVASSDMSHYLAYDEAKKFDEATVSAMERLQIEGLQSGLRSGKYKLCGGAAVLTLARVAKSLGATGMTRLYLANSGDTTGDKGRVVGYCSVAVMVPETKPQPKAGSKKMEGQLSDAEKKELLKIARTTIVEYVKNRKIPKFEVKSEGLLRPCGAFVTIKRYGQLRGCIGRFSPVTEPLYKVVEQMAIAAATQDPRFPPMTPSELSGMSIEISVLSDLSKIDDPEKIQVGVHGLEIEKGPFRGVLLPQVATEYGWDRIKFLQETCRKAGLPPDAWQKGATIYVFTAQVFSEEE